MFHMIAAFSLVWSVRVSPEIWEKEMIKHAYGIFKTAFLFAALVLATSLYIAGTNAVAETPTHAMSPSGPYILGPNDKVRVKVYGETDITGEYEVDGNGNVSIPLAG